MTIMKKLCAAILALGTLGSGAALASQPIPYAESFESHADATSMRTIDNWSSSASDLSVVTNWNIASLLPTNCTAPLHSSAHTKVLRLNTEDGILTNDFGSTNIAGQLTYLDTLIQFVPNETTPTTLTREDTGIKAAVYVDANTNLVVYHGVLSANGGFANNTNEIIPITLVSSNWYRLTITFDTRRDDNNDLGLPARMFQVKTNGVAVQSPNAYADSWYTEWLTAADMNALSRPGSWFPSSVNASLNSSRNLYSLCFQGTGYIDDLVVTNGAPTYTITLDGPSSYLITVVTGDHGNSKTGGVSLASLSTFTIAANGSTSIVYTASEWYRIAALTSNSVTVAAATSVKFYTQELVNVTADISNNVQFAQVNPGLVHTSLTNIPVDWLANRGTESSEIYANALTPYQLYLLDVSPYSAQTNDFQVTGIGVTNGTVYVGVSLKVNTQPINTFNGGAALTLYGYTNLTTTGTALGTTNLSSGAATFQFSNPGTTNFYRAVIE